MDEKKIGNLAPMANLTVLIKKMSVDRGGIGYDFAHTFTNSRAYVIHAH